jgi:hypothetical protein
MPTTKDYEAQYFLLLEPGKNDSCDHVFMCLRRFLEDH